MGHGDSDCLQSRLEKIVDERLSQLDSEKRHQAKRDKDLDKKLKEFCTAVGAYVAEKKGMEAQEVEELCNNIATAYHEYFWLFERYQIVKDRFSGKERFDMFLNDMLERSYGLNCKISNIGEKKGFIVEDKSEGTLWLSTASGDEVVLEREPHVDRFKLLR